ncbi:hypothetical protein U9R90_10055 [Streptomyces sp. E11-3]|uniref:hypothetical protein n=1 Tax=Streptomyces sp. E11-3 TaxID=3110112 RepID=UPI00397EC81E
MPGDEVQALEEGAAAADEPRVRTGPRHAAPRKPLLTRLQMPAGKAIALAAMPSAVLMGMGLTPTLAQAKPQPDSPFRDGPCVTAPDAEAEDDTDKAPEAEKDAEDAKGTDDQADKADGEDAKDAKNGGSEANEPTPSPSPAAPGSGSGAGAGSDGKADPAPSPSPSASGGQTAEPEPSPAPAETKNPLDPLGVGDALKQFGDDVKDFFTPGDETEAEDEPSASPSPTTPDATKDDSPVDQATKPVEDAVKDTVGGAKDGLDDTAEKAESAAEDAADKVKDGKDGAEDAVEPSPEEADPMAPDEDGKVPFPCVVEKKVAGEDETPPAPIPNDPWELEATSLLLKGLDYKGVVNLRTPDGRVKQALKFTVDDGTDIGDLHQIVGGPGGKRYHVEAAKGSTSTIRGGQTIMYTERLQGNLFGLIPIVFDPENPPPLNVPIAYFTNVKVTQAGQFGGTLTVPGLHQSITG